MNFETSSVLNRSDICRRSEWLSREWEREALHPTQILRRAIEAGLESDHADPGQFAGDAAMTLCVSRTIETESTDLIGIAEHVAALADMLVWTVRGEGEAWKKPAPVALGSEMWTSAAYLNGGRLRKLIVADRWPEDGDLAILQSWAVAGECAAYGMEMDLMVAIVGQRREERWHSAWTKGVTHPVNGSLRFRKRDGEAFGDSWGKVWREKTGFSREDWLEAMTEDGVLADSLVVHRVELNTYSSDIRTLAAKRLYGSRMGANLPDPQLSACHSREHPCQFRTCCPYFRLPSEELGFLRLPR